MGQVREEEHEQEQHRISKTRYTTEEKNRTANQTKYEYQTRRRHISSYVYVYRSILSKVNAE
jgi:hypothetical protein